MRRIKIAIICLAFISIIPCIADDAVGRIDPYLGYFEMSQTQDIEMTEETVEIWSDRVKVTFWFTNLTDKTQTITVGFPVKEFRNMGENDEYRSVFGGGGIPLGDDDASRKQIEDYYQFKSWCNGKKLPRMLVSDIHKKQSSYDDEEFDFWFVSELKFKPHEVLKVTDTYHTNPSYFGESTGIGATIWGYTLITGSNWANVIKKATIIFHTDFYVSSSGLNYLTDDNYMYGEDILYGGTNCIWNLTENTLKWFNCTYEPYKILWNDKKNEGTITWILENIKPERDWIFSRYGKDSVGYGHVNLSKSGADMLPFFVIQDLKNQPDFDSNFWAYDRYSDEEYKVIYNNLYNNMTKEKFQFMLESAFKAAFSDSQPKTKTTAIYARFMINSIYALHGYKFKDQELNQQFSKFSWYSPTYAELHESDFSAHEQEMISKLKKYR